VSKVQAIRSSHNALLAILKALALSSHALIRVSKVRPHHQSGIWRLLSGLVEANFKEAGEAKENYDLRTIFDNT
jgi:hypothetical protein